MYLNTIEGLWYGDLAKAGPLAHSPSEGVLWHLSSCQLVWANPRLWWHPCLCMMSHHAGLIRCCSAVDVIWCVRSWTCNVASRRCDSAARL